jgi:hypothetical protein
VVLCLRDLLEAAGRLRAPAGAAAVQTSARSQRNSRAPAGPLRAACVRPCSRGKQSALACQDCLACLAMAACLPCPGACPGLWLSCSCHVCEAHITRVWPESAPGAGASLPMRSQNCILIPVAACAAGCGQPQQRTEERARRMGAWIHTVAIRGVRGAYAYCVRTHRVRVVCLCPSSRSCSSSAAATGCGEGPPPCTTGWCQKAMQAPNEKIASTSRRSFHRAVI